MINPDLEPKIQALKEPWGVFYPVLMMLFASGFVFMDKEGNLWVPRVEIIPILKPNGNFEKSQYNGGKESSLLHQETRLLGHSDGREVKRRGDQINFDPKMHSKGKDRLYYNVGFLLEIFKAVGQNYIDLEYKTTEFITLERKHTSIAQYVDKIQDLSDRFDIPWLEEWVTKHFHSRSGNLYINWEDFKTLLMGNGNKILNILDTIWPDVISEEQTRSESVLRTGGKETEVYLLRIDFFLECVKKSLSTYGLNVTKQTEK